MLLIRPSNTKEMRRKEILAKHPYRVYQSTDGFWHTYVTDETKKSKRRQIKKKSQKAIEDELVRFYTNSQGEDLSTLENIYPHWLKYKFSVTAASTTVRRLGSDWNTWLKDEYIVKVPIDSLDSMELTKWACNFVKGNNKKKTAITAKQYYNISGILRRLLEFAENKGIIDESPFQNVKVDKRFFKKKPVSTDDSDQVFRDDELQGVRELALRAYFEENDEAALAIFLISYTGIRAGEACGLRWNAFNEDMSEMMIRTQLVKKEVLNEDGTWTQTIFEIIEFPKTEAGYRVIYIPEKIRDILQHHKTHTQHNKPTDCVFLSSGGKLLNDTYLYRRTRKYSEQTSKVARGTHKLRKTYLSVLYDGGIHERSIMRIAGHSQNGRSAGVTLRTHYLRDRATSKEIQGRIEEIIYLNT